ncbi:hypothetical protein DPX16_9182 [Anabarilius grahami]|uniref:Uncharacterized protein n=1 Tax=Anabarilius grahami TaxID=495550 RepID=A0A3N0Z8L4_ANAGA|nr:hypothetical protein DPX16_9182 [Anabarilius grahami]
MLVIQEDLIQQDLLKLCSTAKKKPGYPFTCEPELYMRVCERRPFVNNNILKDPANSLKLPLYACPASWVCEFIPCLMSLSSLTNTTPSECLHVINKLYVSSFLLHKLWVDGSVWATVLVLI